jgi:hypothetical protein
VLLQTVIVLVAFAISYLAPGNALRVAQEIERWLPQFATMSAGHRVFITLQWLLSGFANQSKMLLIILWILCLFLLTKKKDTKSRILAGLAAMATIIAILPYFGITMFSEMGMGSIDPAVPVTEVATPSSLSRWNWIAMLWWVGALVLTLLLLWNCQKSLREKVVAVLLFLASIASAAIMYFSPTIYASGGRVFFVTQVLIWLLIGIFFLKQESKKQKWFLLSFFVAGIVNVVNGISYVLSFLN